MGRSNGCLWVWVVSIFATKYASDQGVAMKRVGISATDEGLRSCTAGFVGPYSVFAETELAVFAAADGFGARAALGAR